MKSDARPIRYTGAYEDTSSLHGSLEDLGLTLIDLPLPGAVILQGWISA